VGADGGHDGCDQLRDQFIYKFNIWLPARSTQKGAKTPDENAYFNANALRQLSTIAIQAAKSSMKVTKLLEETLDFGLRNVAARPAPG
jgi:hypothetical protein